jgi:ribosomal protein L13
MQKKKIYKVMAVPTLLYGKEVLITNQKEVRITNKKQQNLIIEAETSQICDRMFKN